MPVATPLNQPWFGDTLDYQAGESNAVSDDIPARYACSIGEHGYVLDLRREAGYDRTSVEVTRQQADQSAEPGEQSFSPTGLWRRSVESWHLGAGQEHLDLVRAESDRDRFYSSKGIDPWQRGRLCLLNDVDQKRESLADNLHLLVARDRLYLVDGAQVLFTEDLDDDSPTWTAVTGLPGGTVTGAATDGDRVWVTAGSAVYRISSGTATAFASFQADLLVYAAGRLLAGVDAALYELDSAGDGTEVFTHPNDNWTWDAGSASPNGIYVAGHAGNNGELYRIGLVEATTALDAPTVATQLPDGEYVTSLFHYVGAVVLGTNRGVRVATIDTGGFLTYGSLVAETGGPVYALEPQDRFCWFGWTSYDGTDSGLGRMDLSVFTAPLRPAYASDLMAGSLGTVRSCATYQGRRVFSIAAVGVFAETPDVSVESGEVLSGLLRFGTSERKLVEAIDVRHDQLPMGASIQVDVATENDVWVAIATVTDPGLTGPDTPYTVPDLTAEAAQVRLTLYRSSLSTSPCVTRWTLKAIVMPPRATRIVAPLILASQVDSGDEGGQLLGFDPLTEYQYLKGLERVGRPVVYQEGSLAERVVVERVGFVPRSWNDLTDRWFNGTCLVQMITTEEGT